MNVQRTRFASTAGTTRHPLDDEWEIVMQLQGGDLSLNLQGGDVARLQTELGQLGHVIAAQETAGKHFGASTQQAVMSFQQQHALPPTGTVDAPTATQINAAVDNLPPARAAILWVPITPQPTPSPPANSSRNIASAAATANYDSTRGSTSIPNIQRPRAGPLADGKPLTTAVVQAVDRDLRGEEMLGQMQTDRDGRYEIRYAAKQFGQLEKGSADLVIRAINPAGAVVANSSILFNAPPEATIDLVLGDEDFRGPSEYEQLIAELTPLLPRGVTFADLTEDGTHQDISFLTGETGQDSRRIAFLAAAYRVTAKTALLPEAFYALFAEKLPTDLANLQAKGSEALSAALAKALQENIVPASLRDQAHAIVSRLVALDIEQPLFVVTPAVLYASRADTAGCSGCRAHSPGVHFRRIALSVCSNLISDRHKACLMAPTCRTRFSSS